jgi:hypothetical protein
MDVFLGLPSLFGRMTVLAMKMEKGKETKIGLRQQLDFHDAHEHTHMSRWRSFISTFFHLFFDLSSSLHSLFYLFIHLFLTSTPKYYYQRMTKAEP